VGYLTCTVQPWTDTHMHHAVCQESWETAEPGVTLTGEASRVVVALRKLGTTRVCLA
jgi:hypothetical protein